MAYAAALAGVLRLVACGDDGASPAPAPAQLPAPMPSPLPTPTPAPTPGVLGLAETPVATFTALWAMTFLPDDRLLVADNATQTMSLVTKAGAITPVTGLPKVNGLYDVALSPRYASTGFIYFTFAEPTLPGVTPIPTPDTSGVTGTLSLAVGRLVETADGAKLDRIQ